MSYSRLYPDVYSLLSGYEPDFFPHPKQILEIPDYVPPPNDVHIYMLEPLLEFFCLFFTHSLFRAFGG